MAEPNVRRLLSKITISEFYEWNAYHELEPFDEQRADLRTARLCQILYNVNRRKGSAPLTLDKFMPDFEKQAKKRAVRKGVSISSDGEIERKMSAWVRLLNN